jgi:hypothetical protein
MLENTMDNLKMAGAKSTLVGNFPQVTVLNDLYRKLQTFEAEIKATLNPLK